METVTVTQQQIVRALREAGIRPGDRMVVHSSLKSFGRVEGGAAAVAAACVEAVGEAGTVMMPTFTHYTPGDPLKPEGKPTWTGRIGLALAQCPGAVRDAHPLYSFAYRGPDAGELARMNEAYIFHWGRDKCLHRLAEKGGWVVLLGVGHRSNSTVHLVEELADVDYLQTRKRNCKMTLAEFAGLDPAQQAEALRIHNTGPQRDFDRIEPWLEQAGVQRKARAGAAEVRAVKGMAVIEVGLEAIRREPGFLLAPASRSSA